MATTTATSTSAAIDAVPDQEGRAAPAAVAEGDEQLLRPLVGLWRPPVTAKVSDFGLR